MVSMSSSPPSREEIKSAGHTMSRSAHAEEMAVLRAYVSGRLFDRKTIDYEALMQAIADIVPNFEDHWGPGFLAEYVEAAIGDTDELALPNDS